MISPRSIHRIALPALVLFGQACADARHTEIEEARDRTISDAVSAQAEQLGEDPYRVALAQRIHGFGGIYYDPPGSDRLVIAIAGTATADFAKAQEAVRDYLMARFDPPLPHAPPVEFVRRPVEYSFMELARLRARLRPHVFESPDVVSLDVLESANRIAIGVSDESAVDVVRDLARDLEIPLEMLSFQEESMAAPSYARMDDSSSLASDGSTRPRLDGFVPDGKLQGGYEVAAERKSECTLGFTALGMESGVIDPTEWLFVTASHCSPEPFRLDSALFNQPRYGEPAGHELLDPNPQECPKGSYTLLCRWSDATLVRADSAPIWPGIIGRPLARASGVGQCEADGDCPNAELEVDPDRPHLLITRRLHSVTEGETLDKVGRTTGWTYGPVKVINLDRRSDSLPGNIEYIKIRGTTAVDFDTSGGDSGSPVFSLLSDVASTVALWGIFFATDRVAGEDGVALVSPLRNIERDFGERLVVINYAWPDLFASIAGPKMVVGPVECTWTATVEVGEDPYWGSADPDGDPWWWPWSYAWSGILSGDGEELTGTAQSSGLLHLDVTDQRGLTATDSMYVQVVPYHDSIGLDRGCYNYYRPEWF